ncbi:MAG: hypothetical protein V2A79_12725 [Planctomycetota bacterium]
MFRHKVRLAVGIISVILAVGPQAQADQLRIANWNVTNYSSGRVSEFQTAIYGVYLSRSMAPDILIGQEFTSAAGVTNFLNILNTASGSPGDWAAAGFIDGPDTDNAFFYRTTKVDLLASTVISYGGLSPSPPRNTLRYDVRLDGFASPEATVAIYSSHMKSGDTPDDLARRLLEAQRIRDNAETLTAGWHFLIGGDFNIPTSTENAYQELVGSQADNSGRFFDPINTPGYWQNNCDFRFVHTQDPACPPSGGMDDRFDQILVSASLKDTAGFDYVGNATIPYSTTTWNDPNHSYRSWGNDGTSCNACLTTVGNTMVGQTIAEALEAAALTGGHLPVFADFTLPDKGACCLPCGCADGLDQATCEARGGEFCGIDVLCGEEVPPCEVPPVPDDVIINEVLVAHNGIEDREFVELVGQPDEGLCGLTILVIEGEGATKGTVELALSLDNCGGWVPCALDAEGYFVAGGSGLSSEQRDLLIGGGTYIFENGTETFALVLNCLVGSGDDIDTNNDGVVDVPVGTVLDAIAIVDSGYPASDKVYFSAPAFGPDVTTVVPPGAARCPDGVDTDTLNDWVRLSAALDGSDGCVPVTPGLPNPAACGGDFDGDGHFDLYDFAAFQECFGLATPACSALELDGQCGIGLDDFERFVPRLTGP